MKSGKLTRETINQLGVQPRKFPAFSIGDTVAISQWITEGTKKRIQIFEGDVIGKHGNGASSTFRVRKLAANGVYVERIYPYYSPIIDSIKIVRRGDVRRAKLYYLRDRIGKKARVKELVLTKEQKVLAEKKDAQKIAAAASTEKVTEPKVEKVSEAPKAEDKAPKVKEAAPKKEAAATEKVEAPKVEKKPEEAKTEKESSDKKD